MMAECNIPNCDKQAPDTEVFCFEHRGLERRRIPFAFCCAEAGGDAHACDCVNKNHGHAYIYSTKDRP